MASACRPRHLASWRSHEQHFLSALYAHMWLPCKTTEFSRISHLGIAAMGTAALGPPLNLLLLSSKDGLMLTKAAPFVTT